MKFIYCLLFSAFIACQSKKSETATSADAYRDLLVDRVVWKKGDPGPTHETPMNTHGFTITNTSDAYLYRQIEVRFDYFDSSYHKVSSSRKTLNKTIGPRAALALGQIQDGPVQAGVKSSTVTIVNAASEVAAPEK